MSNQPLPYHEFLRTLRESEIDALKASPVLVIGNDPECTDRLVQAIRGRGLEAIACPDMSDAQSLLAQMAFSLVFCGEAALEGQLRYSNRMASTTPVILLSRSTEENTCVDGDHRGVFDCISCPPAPETNDSILTLARKRSAAIG